MMVWDMMESEELVDLLIIDEDDESDDARENDKS